MLPDEHTRLQVLEIFFRIYIDIYGKYGDIVATSEDFGGLAYIYYEDRPKHKIGHMKDLMLAVFKCIDFLRYVPCKKVIQMIKTLKVMSSEWIYKSVKGNYIHLDLIVVKEEARGKGKSKQILNYVINEASKLGMPLTLETQNPENIPLYEHFGFKVIDTITYEGMIQYCMIKQPETV